MARNGRQPLSEVMSWPMSYLHRFARNISESFTDSPPNLMEEDA